MSTDPRFTRRRNQPASSNLSGDGTISSHIDLNIQPNLDEQETSRWDDSFTPLPPGPSTSTDTGATNDFQVFARVTAASLETYKRDNRLSPQAQHILDSFIQCPSIFQTQFMIMNHLLAVESKLDALLSKQTGAEWKCTGDMKKNIRAFVRAALLSSKMANYGDPQQIIKAVFVQKYSSIQFPRPDDTAGQSAFGAVFSTEISQAKNEIKNAILVCSHVLRDSSTPQKYFSFPANQGQAQKRRRGNTASGTDNSESSSMQSWTHLPSKDIVTLTHSLLKRSEIHIPVTLGVYQRVAVIRYVLDNFVIDDSKKFWPEVENTLRIARHGEDQSALHFQEELKWYYDEDIKKYGAISTELRTDTMEEAANKRHEWQTALDVELERASVKLPKPMQQPGVRFRTSNDESAEIEEDEEGGD